MLVNVYRINNYFYVNGKKITCRDDYEKLNEEDKFELNRKRRLFLNEKQRQKKR